MKVLMHALAASCEELRARTGNPPLVLPKVNEETFQDITKFKIAYQKLRKSAQWQL
jgi:hypothetical protein